MHRRRSPSEFQRLALQRLERDARRLRAAHAGDLLVRLALAIDLRVRRVAHYAGTRLVARGRALTSTH